MNTYSKFCPNVFLAKCTEQHEKGEVINVETKYGKENGCIVHNLIYQKDGFYFYSITRADGYNNQERARNKVEKLTNWADNADKKGDEWREKSNEGKDFLALAEPIKVGHHSEKRHRSLIERNRNRMNNAMEEFKKADAYRERTAYWESMANKIDLSMPESLEFFEIQLEEAKEYHQKLKDFPELRSHSMSLQYANKAVKDLEEKVYTAVLLWGEPDEVEQVKNERQAATVAKATKTTKKQDIIDRHNGFFAFNNEQFTEGYNKLKIEGVIDEGEKVVHIGFGLYIPKSKVESFLTEYKK